MPVFNYKGVDANSKAVSGTVDADSEKGARGKLRKLRIYPTKVNLQGGSGSSGRKLFQTVKVEDVANMCRQMSVLLNANIPLIDTLEAGADQSENPIIRKALSEIKEKVSEGARLGDCMVSYPKVFDGLFVHMVRAGEISGQLDVVFNRLADYKESQADLKSKVKSAMMYPVIMMIVAVLMLAFLFTQVVPKIIVALEKQKAAIPPLTKFVMGVTYVVQNYWYVIIIAAFLIFTLFKAWKKSDSGGRKLDEWALKAPILGPLKAHEPSIHNLKRPMQGP